MKRFYEAPELELIRFNLRDAILSSQEGEIGEHFGNGDDVIDDLDDLLDP